MHRRTPMLSAAALAAARPARAEAESVWISLVSLDMVSGAKRFTAANPGHVRAFLAAQAEANKLIADDPARATQLPELTGAGS